MKKPPPLRKELLDFATSHDKATWRTVLADPQAAEAMRQVRDRVRNLHREGRALRQLKPVPPECLSLQLNRAGSERQSEGAFCTSNFNPLTSTGLETGWDPKARRWTGRQGLANIPKDPTSFWNPGWGACASDKGLDTDFQYLDGRYGHDKALHPRGWR